jgi:hypothetical protein
MNLLIVKSDDQLINDNCESIGRAWSECNHPTAVWAPDAFPAFDIFTKFKPDIVLCSMETKNRAFLKCLNEFKPKIVYSDKFPIYGDIVNYNKKTALINAEELKSKLSSIVAYSDKEYDKLDLSIDFKLFSNIQKRIHQYCGGFDNEIRKLIISSCAEFIPTNRFDELNATLMGKKVRTNYSVNLENIRNNFTSFHGCKKIWKKINIDKMENYI